MFNSDYYYIDMLAFIGLGCDSMDSDLKSKMV